MPSSDSHDESLEFPRPTERVVPFLPAEMTEAGVRAYASMAQPDEEVPREFDTWIEVPLDEDWIAALRIRFETLDRCVVAELRVFPGTPDEDRMPGEWSDERYESGAPIPPGGVPTGKIRKLKLREYADLFTRYDARSSTTVSARLPAELWSTQQEERAERQRPGRRPPTDLECATFAQMYTEACDKEPGYPSAELTRRLKREAKKPDNQHTVKGRIKQVRRRGFLTTNGRGRAGGQLTEKAERLLAQASRK